MRRTEIVLNLLHFTLKTCFRYTLESAQQMKRFQFNDIVSNIVLSGANYAFVETRSPDGYKQKIIPDVIRLKSRCDSVSSSALLGRLEQNILIKNISTYQ